jgi:hypothetical protein
MKKTLRYALFSMVIVLVGIQFIRVDKRAPPVNVEDDFLTLTRAPSEIAQLVREACYDCHSYETNYPWYSNLAPVSWWVKHHINEGRAHLNYNLFGTYTPKKQAHKIEESIEAIRDGWMPLDAYAWNHPEARLSAEQRTMLADWFSGLELTNIESDEKTRSE